MAELISGLTGGVPSPTQAGKGSKIQVGHCKQYLLPLPVTSSCYLFEPQAERHNELKLPLKLNKEDWAERERESAVVGSW